MPAESGTVFRLWQTFELSLGRSSSSIFATALCTPSQVGSSGRPARTANIRRCLSTSTLGFLHAGLSSRNPRGKSRDVQAVPLQRLPELEHGQELEQRPNLPDARDAFLADEGRLGDGEDRRDVGIGKLGADVDGVLRRVLGHARLRREVERMPRRLLRGLCHAPALVLFPIAPQTAGACGFYRLGGRDANGARAGSLRLCGRRAPAHLHRRRGRRSTPLSADERRSAWVARQPQLRDGRGRCARLWLCGSLVDPARGRPTPELEDMETPRETPFPADGAGLRAGSAFESEFESESFPEKSSSESPRLSSASKPRSTAGWMQSAMSISTWTTSRPPCSSNRASSLRSVEGVYKSVRRAVPVRGALGTYHDRQVFPAVWHVVAVLRHRAGKGWEGVSGKSRSRDVM
jgi:hypothetical protein